MGLESFTSKMAYGLWPIPLSLWLVSFFVLQLTFSHMPPPVPLPLATQEAIDLIDRRDTVVTSVKVEVMGYEAFLCEVSFSISLETHFPSPADVKAKPCIGGN